MGMCRCWSGLMDSLPKKVFLVGHDSTTQLVREMVDKSDSEADRIHIDLGSPIYVEIGAVQGRLKSKLIGMEEDYLIIRTPLGPPGTRSKCYDGNSVVVRYIHHGTVYGFESKIIGTIITPYNLMFISYPKIIAEQSLRENERFDCYFPCHINMGEVEGPGTIVDISMGGCRCIVPIEIQDEKHRIPAIDSDIAIAVDMPDGEQKIEIHGAITNTTEYHSAARIGLRFIDLNDDSRDKLKSLIHTLI
jgi:c-di-GMP-binding flagellar brake protein YcgR